MKRRKFMKVALALATPAVAAPFAAATAQEAQAALAPTAGSIESWLLQSTNSPVRS